MLIFVGSLAVLSMFILAEITKGVSDGQTTSDDFHLTACLWQDSRCIHKDTEQFASEWDKPCIIDGKPTSAWPSGSYVLLTPNDGCPESFAKGWRRGYISLTWKHRHTLMSATVCNVKNFYSRLRREDGFGCEREFESNKCLNNMTENIVQWRTLTRELWPEIQSVMLGPFSEYAMRINFCFKMGDEKDVQNSLAWPEGSYTIFGARNSTCPQGFTSSIRQLKLPTISTWTSHGFLPDFTIKEREEDELTLLTLKTCDHETDNTASNYNTSQIIFSQDTFVVIQTDQNASCPQFQDTDVIVEVLGLRQDATDIGEIQYLFTVCSYSTAEQFIDSDPHLYDALYSHSFSTLFKEYVILNPTLIYGSGKTGSANNFLNKSGAQLPYIIGYQLETVPWLLVDLGRHLLVVGLKFTNFNLTRLFGKDYRGTKNVSISGCPCQRWDSPLLSWWKGDDFSFPDKTISDAENYCRDPYGFGLSWCFITNERVDICAFDIDRFGKDDKPFSKCFISDDRWRMDEFGAISCLYKVFYHPGVLYYSFLKELGGRYVKLVGYAGTDSSSFNSRIQNVEVLTSAKNLHDESSCSSDLGMGDESVQEFQIKASSWLPQFPPSSGRPLFPGWCSRESENNPYITVDMMKNTIFDGITVFNLERIEEKVISGIYEKTIIPVGSKTIMVSYSNKSWASTNKTFNMSMDMFLPINQPQKFFHDPVVARYVTVYIIESMTTDANCLRFELHGCKQIGTREIDLPSMKVLNPYLNLITIINVLLLANASVLSSIGYPAHYPMGVSYTWIIDRQEGKFIQLIFSNVSFNIYEVQAWGQCSDTLKFLPGSYHDLGIIIDQRFNGFVSIVDTDVSYVALAFTTCRPTSKIQSVGKGFKAFVKTQEVPTCFSLTGNYQNKIQNSCTRPMMYLTSVARQNFPDNHVTEEWNIHVARFSVHLEILYFNVRCDTGLGLYITDRFSGEKQYCNLRKPLWDMFSDSNTIYIRFKKEQDSTKSSTHTQSSREGFKVIYRTFRKNMAYLVDSHKTIVKAVLNLADLEKNQGDPLLENAIRLTHKACSKKFGKCYSIYSGARTTWTTAGAECWIRQRRLVSIHSEEEYELVKYILRNFRYIDIGPRTVSNAFSSDSVDPNYFTHIGLSRMTSRTDVLHVWEDGSPVTFSAWKAGEPSVQKACTRMSFHLLNTKNTWEAEYCEHGTANYFICEQPLTPKLLHTASHLNNGTHNQTLSGIPCQRWDSQSPHQHSYNKDKQFPDESVSAAENYCRDPSISGYLWCYTENLSVPWEECLFEETDDFLPRLYDGYLSKTYSGRTCQRWEKQDPHKHPYNKTNFFPDKSLDMVENHCRDPSNEGSLWCYTTDNKLEREMCKFKDTASDRCYSTHSQYTGKWNRTLSGEACQPWVSQTSNGHELFQDSQFPDRTVAEASNFCRDPYAEGFLWCFTVNPAIKMEPCVFEYKYSIEDETFNDAFLNLTFQCYNGEIIPLEYVCNGISNCLDVTDELNCKGKVHALMENREISTEIQEMNDTLSLFQCRSNEWIHLLARCDGLIDCYDATDELNCSSSAEHGCSTKEYTCEDGECIHISQMCDFIADCRDASDENCDFPQCLSMEYRCQNQQCISMENRCDAFENCLDGTDEIGCDVCKENTFHCDFVRCIPQRMVCDKYPDCVDGSDEMSCDQPIRHSCEEWWTAGYRKSGIYQLNDSDAGVECNFDKILTEGNIYTIFHNFEITARSGVEEIHSTEAANESSYIHDRFFKNNSYTCTQNITQACIPAYKAAADNEDLNHTEAFRHCDCLVMMINPGRYDVNSSKVVECEGDEVVTDTDRLFFRYREYKSKRNITLKEYYPSGVEITVGPAVCKHVNDFVETNVGCGDENVYPSSFRCVYDTDPAGYLLGCRSGQHLQECELFECPVNTVKCPGSFCLPLKFICDGVRHCPGAQDEQNCGCMDADREVIFLYEDRNNLEENREFRKIASQFYTTNSVVRELRYHLKTLPDKLEFDHRILDISDKEINPYSTIDRQYACNYSILASDFINRIQFKKRDTTAVIFLQKRNGTGKLPKMIFGNLKSRPNFFIYRVIEKINNSANDIEAYPFVQSVFVKRITMLNTIAANLFPELCPGSSTVFCPHAFRCTASKTCIPLEQVCDGHAQCIHGDDERLCEFSCPEKCECSEYTTNCSFSNITNNTLPNLNNKSRWIDLSRNPGLSISLLTSIWEFPYLIYLNLSNCDIHEIKAIVFQLLANLRILDLSLNTLSKIPASAFKGLQKLKILNLFGNREIYSLEPYSLTGLSSLDNFEIKGANISKLSKNAFFGLNLNQLVFSENEINDMEDEAFGGLTVKLIDIEKNTIANFDQGLFRGVLGIISLRAPSFKFCCVRPNYLEEENCYPEKDEFSSCGDLLRLPALQTMLWLIGIFALFGNVSSVVYRLVYDRERSEMGYCIFVTNLAVADFLMGIYLIIIAIADAIFRKRYIFVDDFWRNSAWCTVAGFLSTVSSEASVFFLCLITLDRLFVIKYPFGRVRFDVKKSGVACLISWIIAMSIGLIPILEMDYFHGRFYSKSGVCIALPLTRDRPPGWLYSVIIFVGLNFVTFCLIGIGQIAIYLEIKDSTAGIRKSSSTWGNAGSGRRRELTVARNLLLVVATDFLCWFPIGFMSMMAMSGHVISGDVYAWTTVFILPVNAALNPVLYTLTAIIGKKKSKLQMDKSVSLMQTHFRSMKVQPFNGLFRYFITRDDSHGQTFVSLNDVLRENITIKAIDVLKISLHLTRSLRLLHKNSLVLPSLDGSVVYTSVQYGKIIGDIQLRQEPIVCCNKEKKGDDMDILGQLIRRLLAKRNKQMIAKN